MKRLKNEKRNVNEKDLRDLKEMFLNEVLGLQVGDSVTSLFSGNGYVVIGHEINGTPIVVRQLSMNNPTEWSNRSRE